MIPAFDDTAPFIWAAYAFTALVLLGVAAAILARASAARSKLEAAIEEDEHEP
ncbi:MAG: heme exporter protein CcmD [Pseudomonadota bacterium]